MRKKPKKALGKSSFKKLVCTRAKTEKEVYEAVYKLENILEEDQLITYATPK